VVVVPFSWKVRGAFVSISVEELSFVCFKVGGLVFGVWEPAKKFRRLPSCLEGPDFWPGAMVEERVGPVGGGW